MFIKQVYQYLVNKLLNVVINYACKRVDLGKYCHSYFKDIYVSLFKTKYGGLL